MPLETPARIVQELTDRGLNAQREAATLLAEADQPALALELVVEHVPDDALLVTAEHVEQALANPVPDPAAASTADSETEPASATNTAGGSDASVGAPANPDASAGTHDNPDASAGTHDNPDASAETHDDPDASAGTHDDPDPTADRNPQADPSVSGGTSRGTGTDFADSAPAETEGSSAGRDASPDAGSTDGTTGSAGAAGRAGGTGGTGNGTTSDPETVSGASGREPTEPTIGNDVTGESTGTGAYDEFVQVFRDRYERLSGQLRGRVNHRPADTIGEMSPGSEVAMIGLVNDIRSTASGHRLIELEDTTGTFPTLVMKDRELASVAEELLLDECIAVEGSLSDDAGLIFADAIHFPDVPRTYRPSTADRSVSAALISDVHVGSEEFMAEAWEEFADWLHTPAASDVEYLLIAGDMVEGVGVYPDQDEELAIVDIYDQYEAFSERLKSVPGDIEIVMIPGNHDAVRLAEPQPAFDEELREIMSAHDARVTGNPSVVTIENVSVLMYHGVSLDELIAELPDEKASYDEPHKAMYQLLKKRHVAPQYGGHIRLAPEERDYLVVDEIPDVFHTGHVHKLGYGKYHNVLAVNSGCWQAQTAFQESVNIDPDAGFAPILDLETLDLTIRKFA